MNIRLLVYLNKWLAGSSSNLQGILFMLISTLVLSSMHAMVRYVSAELHPFEIAFFRNLFGFVAVIPLLVHNGRTALATKHPRMQILRSVIGVGAMLCWFYGLSVVPIAEATALSFSAAIFASIGAVLILGEKMRLRRWSAVIIGFLGTLVILRPGFAAVDHNAFYVLASSVCWGFSVVIVKHLSRSDSTVTIVAWMGIMLTVLSFFPALLVWVWPTPQQLAWLVLIGTVATLGHLAMTEALKLTEATAVMPLDFTRLLWTSVIGYVVFTEVPDLWTWIGGTMIFGSAAYITYRESKLQRTSRGVQSAP